MEACIVPAFEGSAALGRGPKGRFVSLGNLAAADPSMAATRGAPVVRHYDPADRMLEGERGAAAAGDPQAAGADSMVSTPLNGNMQDAPLTMDAASSLPENAHGNDDCVMMSACDGIPISSSTPSTIFWEDTRFALGAGQTPPVAHRTRAQGARSNASPKLPQPGNIFGGLQRPIPHGSSPSTAWKQPKVIPLPSLQDLGQISNDGDIAMLDDDEVEATSKLFEFALVGRLFGRKIPFARLTSEISRIWTAFGKFRLVTIGGDCFVCIFDNKEACDAILMGGPWVVWGQVLGVDLWSPTFSPSSSTGFKTPVWIRMPGLPLYCWGSKNIARIAAQVGEPLWTDSATHLVEKGTFARACVRIDLSFPLKHGVWVQGRHGKFFQNLEYEGLSVFCYQCCQVGHKASSCKGKAAAPPNNIPAQPHSRFSVAAQNVLATPPSHGPEGILSCAGNGAAPPYVPCTVQPLDDTLLEDRGAGPWMMVTRKKRSPQRLKPPSRTSSPSRQCVKLPPSSLGMGGQEAELLPRTSQLRSSSPCKDDPPPAQDAHAKFSGFHAAAKGNKDRVSKGFLDKMINELGPVAYGSRKKRRQAFRNDGGDASPFEPP